MDIDLLEYVTISFLPPSFAQPLPPNDQLEVGLLGLELAPARWKQGSEALFIPHLHPVASKHILLETPLPFRLYKLLKSYRSKLRGHNILDDSTGNCIRCSMLILEPWIAVRY
jgi:hypothetical protein